MNTPKFPHLPQAALLLNASLPMVEGGAIIPQQFWMESQMRNFAQAYALPFATKVAELQMDLAGAIKDAERYRWLRAAGWIDEAIMAANDIVEHDPSTLDAAVDRLPAVG